MRLYQTFTDIALIPHFINEKSCVCHSCESRRRRWRRQESSEHKIDKHSIKTEIRQYRFIMSKYYVYILASKRNGTLYTGITNDLPRRISEHKDGLIEGFSRKYDVKQLVYFEEYNKAYDAILREKRIKKWKRAWKLKLIEKNNKDWNDLYYELF